MGSVIKSLRIAICLLCLTFLSGNLLWAFPGESGRARVGSRARRSSSRGGESRRGSSRRGLSHPEMRVPQLSPELEKFLKNWHLNSKKVKKLEGKLYRFVYDSVFKTDKRASGFFYYEGPDKARMDIEPAEIRREQKGRRGYTIKRDHQTKWISDGKRIIAVNDQEKNYEVHPIPPSKQGENIMDGPLPFLFGMPPDKAKVRYRFKLIKETKKKVWLAVHPKWRQDAANWSEAKVIISKTNYLPTAVQLISPSKNLETVYQFYDLGINKRENPFLRWVPDFIRTNGGRDPFVPPRGYREVKLSQSTASNSNQAPKLKKGEALVPSVVGKSYKKAEDILRKAGFVPKLRKGTITKNPKLYYHIERQQPPGRTPFPKGQTVVITLYLEPK